MHFSSAFIMLAFVICIYCDEKYEDRKNKNDNRKNSGDSKPDGDKDDRKDENCHEKLENCKTNHRRKNPKERKDGQKDSHKPEECHKNPKNAREEKGKNNDRKNPKECENHPKETDWPKEKPEDWKKENNKPVDCKNEKEYNNDPGDCKKPGSCDKDKECHKPHPGDGKKAKEEEWQNKPKPGDFEDHDKGEKLQCTGNCNELSDCACVSTSLGAVKCYNNKCRCRRDLGFTGGATKEKPCTCTKIQIEGSNGIYYCLSKGQIEICAFSHRILTSGPTHLCSFNSQCLNFAIDHNPNAVICEPGGCVCNNFRGFTGGATIDRPCTCTKEVVTIDTFQYCLDLQKCIDRFTHC